MPIPVSSSLTQLNSELFFQEGFELSLDAIIPSVELTGSFTPFESKTQFFIYDYAKEIVYSNLRYEANGTSLFTPPGTSTSNSTSSYNQFELNPTEDVYNQGYSNGNYYAVYNFINYELGSETKIVSSRANTVGSGAQTAYYDTYDGHPYFIKDISGDRTELRIQNNNLSSTQIENYYNTFKNKIDLRENADEFYVSFGNNRNFIAVNSQLEVPVTGSSNVTSILIKLYKPLPAEFEVDRSIQIISKVGETQVFEVQFKPNLEFIDNLLSLKGPNYNIDLKDRVNNSTNFKSLNDLINTNSSQSYYQLNSLQDERGVILRKNWADWNQFVKYSSAEQRLNNFHHKMVSIEAYQEELLSLSTIPAATRKSPTFSSSYNGTSEKINQIITKFDSYEYFLYYITGSESWPKYGSTYPYPNYSVTSSEALNWFGSTNEQDPYYNTGKNQIYSASRYDNNNQDYLYYLIPPFITDNSSNDQYTNFVNMTGQAFDEMYLYTEAVEQVRNTNSGLTGSVLPLDLADEVITSLGFDTYANSFNSTGFNVNTVGVLPSAGSGLEYITRYIDIASGSVINYYDQQQSTLGYVVALADPSFPYPLDNAAQEIYKRIFHNMVSLVKRKGTVTGLRQLINIWGVPSTMLRISEFGGKNKDDENDYDLWMNRYSTAFNSFATPSTSSIPDMGRFGNVNANAMFPWLPLNGNYVDSTTPNEIAVPDCIQFRFKTARTADATTNFSESILLKRGQNGGGSYDESNNGDFGIYLHQSGSQSGSYSGATDPHYNTYASMSFVISGSLTQGAEAYRNIAGTNYANCYVTDPIYLPFYNEEWWTVQIQRKTHTSTTQNNILNEFELRVGQNIYDGYDGNKIGWVGSSSLQMVGGIISSSMNEAWNRNYLGGGMFDIFDIHNYEDSQMFLPGNIIPNPVYTANNCVGLPNNIGRPGFDLGDTMSGSFQEFRYYRRALSASSFNDLVMNPESIQGHSDSNTGPGSSYDLLSYRIPLGNELEFTDPNGTASYFDATYIPNLRQFAYGQLKPTSAGGGSFGGQSIGSVHPSAVNYDVNSTLYTSSFFHPTSAFTPKYQPYFLNFRFNTNPNLYVTASYISPNTEINYMDQPAAGIRNRIKNKIQVIDNNEYGTTLSPFRSIQQEFEQSSSYTEDLNSLEVGFSFQNEINDDIISTFGHGVVSDAIADPRFISESSDRYPELTRIAEDYFKKYQGPTFNTPLYDNGLPTTIEKEYDYNRLIKFYETSLFKAIKNYVPARTSLSTGIIVKQHLLERNKTDAVIGININTPVAKTPETGSDSWGYTTQTGFNSVMSQQNLLITSSINMYSLTGSAGGSVNKYNNISTSASIYLPLPWDSNVITNSTKYDLFGSAITSPFVVTPTFNDTFWGGADTNGKGFIESTTAFLSTISLVPNFTAGGNINITLEVTSSIRGGIFSNVFAFASSGGGAVEAYSPISNLLQVYPNERLTVNIQSDISRGLLNINFSLNKRNFFLGNDQSYWYRDNYTGLLKVKDTQEEFYNGEYSGSNIPVELNEYNPYRIYADGSNLNPDTSESLVAPPTTNLAATPYNTTRFPTVTATAATAVPIRATGSLLQYSGSYNSTTGASGDALLIQDVAPPLNTAYQWVKITSEDGITRTYSAIGSSDSRFDISTYPAQENQFILSEETDIFRTQTDGGIFSGTVSTAGTGTFNLTDQYGKQIEMAMQWSGNTIIFATVTNNNLGNDNGSLWPKADSAFLEDDAISFSGHTLTFTLSSAASLNNLPAFGLPNLLMVQFIYSGANFLIAGNLKNAIESSNGHNGSLLVTQHNNQGASNRISLQLFNTTVGNTYANAIQFSTLGTNEFADNVGGICVLDEGGADGDYYFPTTIQQGVDQPSISTIYLQNSITNLTPGITYDISFDITNYATDGFGNSNFDIGLSGYDAPGGTANGIGNTARATSNAAISHSWVQAAGTSVAQFFSATGTYANISNVSVAIPPAVLAPKHFYERDSFTIMPTGSQLFQNSPYNPLLHNVSGSRKNSYLLDMDYDPVLPSTPFIQGLPSDYQFLSSASQLGWEGVATNNNLLEFSDIPDSNYTTTAIINPRYNGSKITSADYNFRITQQSLSQSAILNAVISPLRLPGFQKSSKIRFLNGETGSWEGDSTNEYPSAIDTRPIYFAHFKSSYENYELYDSTTFNIDQLIQVPFTSIQSEQAPIITSSQLTGNNESLVAVGSTFPPNRKLKAFYNQSTKQFRNLKKHLSPSDRISISPTLDYTIADNNSNYIIFPAQEVLSYYTNEKTQQEVVLTHSINAPIWVKDSINYTPPIGSGKPIWQVINTRNNNPLGSISTTLTQSIQPLPLNTFSASTSLLVTGSSPSGNALGYGLLYLQGMAINGEDLYQYNFGSISPSIRSLDLSAPHLQLINSINQNIDIGDISYSTSLTPYLFPDGTINTQITNSCAQWPPSEGDPFASWPFTVSTFVQSPINPNANSNYRLGGGLPSFPSNPLKPTAQKGIQNYFTYNYSMSVLTEYTEKTLPIMIERGDEIRVSYAYPLLTDVVSNASKTNEIITQTFQVLGYEQAPPSLLFGKPLEYNGTSQLGWGSNTAMTAVYGAGSNEFEAIAGNLPPTGLYSPDSLKERFDLLATNQQNIIGLGLSTNDIWVNAFTGSIVSCKVESRWGELSGSSTTVAPTGSIRVKFRGYQGAIASNANRVCQIMSVQEILRTTMGGASGSYQEPQGGNIPSSQYQFIVDDGSQYHPIDPGFIFDTLKVSPDPTTLLKPIPNGSIMSATFKKRIDNDTKVIVNVKQPPGNEGVLTPSGDGYLIPDDLTSTQMDNVQKIINVLKSQNSFTNPPDANETQDVS